MLTPCESGGEVSSGAERVQGAVFGSSLTSQLRHTGRAVAPCITTALRYINDTAAHCDGLFRRPGVLSRVQKLQEIINNDTGNYLAPNYYDAVCLSVAVCEHIKQVLPEVIFEQRVAVWNAPNSRTKLPLSLRRSPPPSNTPIPRPTPFTTPNGIQIQSAVLPQYTFRTG